MQEGEGWGDVDHESNEVEGWGGCVQANLLLRGHGSVPALVILYTIWDLLGLVIINSASASAGTYIFRVISYQCPAQCRTQGIVLPYINH